MQKEIRITSKDNPVLKQYRQLRDQKKRRYAEQKFVTEGFRIIGDALQYPGQVTQIFVTESAVTKYQTILFPELHGTEQIFYLPDSLGLTLTDTEHTQGIFAVCTMHRQPVKIQPEGRYLVLYQLQDPGNMGMILRTCDALGIDAVLTSQCCDLYSQKVIRATMGSVFRVLCADFPDGRMLLDLLHQRQICCYAAVLSEKSVSLTECSLGKGSAVWIGNEGNGLPEEIAFSCDHAVKIPMQGGAESLNAAMAAGLFLWEMMKA